MSFFDLTNVAKTAHGAWLGESPAPRASATGFSIDSRTVRPGELFFALRGEQFDGHDYLAAAARAGAAALVIGRRDVAESLGAPTLLVDDTLVALQRLASARRKSLRSAAVIAVTGSSGKTTTVGMIDAALSTARRGTASEKSFNNHIGVPLTLLRARDDDEYVVCELGSSAAGEIAFLSALVEPDIAVVTNAGRAHSEGLGGADGVRREKANITVGLRPGGVVVAPADDPALLALLGAPKRLTTFGVAPGADVRLVDRVGLDVGEAQRITLEDGAAFIVPAPGAHNALNALVAVVVARAMGVANGDIAEGLSRAALAPMRLERRRIGEIDVWNDAYNANPESAIASLRAFLEGTPDATRRVVVLGDMLELGDEAERAHADVADALVETGGADLVVSVGPLAAAIAGRAARAGVDALELSSADEGAAAPFLDRLRPGDAVFLKASRALRLERIAEAIGTRAQLSEASAG